MTGMWGQQGKGRDDMESGNGHSKGITAPTICLPLKFLSYQLLHYKERLGLQQHFPGLREQSLHICGVQKRERQFSVAL